MKKLTIEQELEHLRAALIQLEKWKAERKFKGICHAFYKSGLEHRQAHKIRGFTYYNSFRHKTTGGEFGGDGFWFERSVQGMEDRIRFVQHLIRQKERQILMAPKWKRLRKKWAILSLCLSPLLFMPEAPHDISGHFIFVMKCCYVILCAVVIFGIEWNVVRSYRE